MRASCVLVEHASEGKHLLPDELRNLARYVRRIGGAYRSNPEAIYAAKDEVAHRLITMARRLEGAR